MLDLGELRNSGPRPCDEARVDTQASDACRGRLYCLTTPAGAIRELAQDFIVVGLRIPFPVADSGKCVVHSGSGRIQTSD